MDDYIDILRRLENMIRYGTILDVQAKPPRVRVQIGQLQTEWRPWLSMRAGETKEWSPPTKGEQCVMLSPSGELTTGVVLVGLASAAYPAPSESLDEHVRTYPDGARVAYNHATGDLIAEGVKTATLKASVKVLVDCPESEFTGNVTIQKKLTVVGDVMMQAKAQVMGLMTYCGGMAGVAGAGVRTVIEMAIEHVGDFINKGRLSSNGVVLDEHDHPDAQGGNTGKPNK